mmetsp:Transcript_16190/g.18635  ORF Transcript_16190/g.18635 Transcript_16190/m.18635 type:complete len:772 (+) Transcript_16190:1404-3719(+)
MAFIQVRIRSIRKRRNVPPPAAATKDAENPMGSGAGGPTAGPSKPAPGEHLAAVLLPEEVCMEVPLADAGLFLHCVLLPQYMYHIERCLTVKSLIKHCLNHMPRLGHYLDNIQLDELIEALTAKSCSLTFNYDRLEYLGEALLKLIHTDALLTSKALHSWVTYLHEGDLSTLRSAMGCNARLREAALNSSVERFILGTPLGRGQWLPVGIGAYLIPSTKEDDEEGKSGDDGAAAAAVETEDKNKEKCDDKEDKKEGEGMENNKGDEKHEGKGTDKKDSMEIDSVVLSTPTDDVTITEMKAADASSDVVNGAGVVASQSPADETMNDLTQAESPTDMKVDNTEKQPSTESTTSASTTTTFEQLPDYSPSDKTCADIIESLLGIIYIKFGIRASIEVCTELGITLPADDHRARTDHMGEVENERREKVRGAAESFVGRKGFRCEDLLVEALTHPSCIHEEVPCYQKLEWVGDAVLCLAAREWVFKTYYMEKVAKLVVIETTLVCNETLAFLCARKKLHYYINHRDRTLLPKINDFDAETGSMQRGLWGTDPPKVLADVVEALMGAVHVDGGFEAGQATALHILKPMIQAVEKEFNTQTGVTQMQMLSMMQPKQVMFEFTNRLLQVRLHKEFSFAQHFSKIPVWRGDHWSKPDMDSNGYVGHIVCSSISLVAVAESSYNVAQNRACALVVAVLCKLPELFEKLKTIVSRLIMADTVVKAAAALAATDNQGKPGDEADGSEEEQKKDLQLEGTKNEKDKLNENSLDDAKDAVGIS